MVQFKIVRLFFVSLLWAAPVFAFSQIPKAYTREIYQCRLHNSIVKFVLADGYISYSSIKLYSPRYHKPIVFGAAAFSEDEHDRMKFITNQTGRHDYFILDNMQDGYSDIPLFISGRYYLNNKTTRLKMHLVAHPDRVR